MNKGLRRSFAQSFLKHQDALKSFLMKRGVNPEDCEDIIQETFLRCYPLLQKNPEGDYRRLFITVARNLHVDAYRRNKRYARDFQAEFFESIPDACEERKDRLQRALIEKMVDAIHERPESRFFKMHYQNGYKIHEIAAMTQTSKGTVSSQIYRFRQRVQATFCEEIEAATELLA
ncbi:MAG TPA: sigma-70 family RNA polymerase sigma factor [Oligoflexus sp.]|uniref:RNA polymerase sigma factor n=1 Tax=Oligoflexus sp. TaxID=1971216 RepID=UPI002D7F264F|nr:sigma-70 family RNA polymerase sigma factor [Oligoflexus sp.]HET9235616.1 sigma-70 family RNA polymerase sigma factor [Oligoflexus sp.]